MRKEVLIKLMENNTNQKMIMEMAEQLTEQVYISIHNKNEVNLQDLINDLNRTFKDKGINMEIINITQL